MGNAEYMGESGARELDMDRCPVQHKADTERCDDFFDGLVCWPSTPPGEQARVDCATIEAFVQALGIVKTPDVALIEAQAYKTCNPEFGWTEKANYSECLNLIANFPLNQSTGSGSLQNKRLIARLNVYLSLLSLCSLLLALLIFSLKSLQCDRLRIHRNFMVSLVLLYLNTIVYFQPYIQDDPQISQILPWYKTTPWLCNLLLSTLMFAFQCCRYC